MKIKPDPVSHLSVLIKWILATDGPVLEMGIGIGSTPVLHELCRTRTLVSYENHVPFYNKFASFQSDWHKLIYVENWKDAEIERPWSVAFVDHEPTLERRDSMLRLKPWADYIIVHDTEKRKNQHYHTRELFDQWKYSRNCKDRIPHTAVLSDKYPV